jgi:hypothetical protein
MKSKLPVFKKLFIPFPPIVIRQGLRGPSILCVPPIVYYLTYFLLIFSLTYYQNMKKMKIPPTDQPESLQCDIEIHQKTTK